MKNKKNKNRHLRVLPGEGRTFSVRQFFQAFFFYLVLLLILLLFIQLGYHWLGEQFLAWRLQIVAAEKGYMINEEPVAGLVTRLETVIPAPAGGEIIRLSPGGERIKAGSEIAVIRAIPLHEDDLNRSNDKDQQTGENL